MYRLTIPPVPRLRDFALLFSGLSSDLTQGSNTWCRDIDKIFWLSKSSISLEFLLDLQCSFSASKQVNILLPSYFCNAALRRMRKEQATFIFYPIQEDLTPDYRFCQKISKEHKVDIFILTHFFGSDKSVPWVFDFCKKIGAMLIEDAAHVLAPTNNIGRNGDAVIYSQHKHLPLYSGASLVIRPDGPSELNVHANVISSIFNNYRQHNSHENKLWLKSLFWFLKRIIQGMGLPIKKKKIGFLEESIAPYTEFEQFLIEPLSARLLRTYVSNIELLGAKRINSFVDWEEVIGVLGSSKSFRLVCSFEDNSIPYQIGFSIGDQAKSEELFNLMQSIELPVSSWPDIPKEVAQNANLHSLTLTKRQQNCFLPLHQNLKNREKKKILRKLSLFQVKKWKVSRINDDDWECLWGKVRQAPITQSLQYGIAKEASSMWESRRYLVSDDQGQPVAIAQMMVMQLPFLGGAARLNMGPVLLPNIGSRCPVATYSIALGAISKHVSKWGLWLIYPSPSLQYTRLLEKYLRGVGYLRMPGAVWASGRLDLRLTKEDLLANLNGKWRNALRKGIKNGVVSKRIGLTSNNITGFSNLYERAQRERFFTGLPRDFLVKLVEQKGKKWHCRLLVAYHISEVDAEKPGPPVDDCLGMVLSVRAGDTATYLLGTVSQKGRSLQANSVLLWEAILAAKHDGCRWFDIGGLNEKSTAGVAHFKKGLNPQMYETAGNWCRLSLFSWPLR